jgi:DNA modification methylase
MLSDFLVYKDDFVELYNCDCREFESDNRTVDLVFADPPFGMSLDLFECVIMTKCSGHTFLMTNERILIPFSNKYIDKFVRMYAVNTVIPNLISNKAPMQLADFVSEFRFGRTRFNNQHECFSNLIESKKLRMMKQYSQNFDKGFSLFAFFFNHFTIEGDLILDPFCGSGKSLIAARRLKRKIIAFEINKDSCNHAIELLSQGDL